MEEYQYVTGFITTDTVESARRIVSQLLDKKLIACGNLVEGAESFYWWNGQIQHSNETIIYIKTDKSLVEKIEAEVTQIHPYDCPCIVFAPLIHMNADYADWLRVVLKSNGPTGLK